MNRTRLVASALFLAGHLFALGCSAPKPEPEIASSAPQSGYAERYPAELQATATSFSEREDVAKRVTGQFQGYPDQLKEPDWKVVLDVTAQADAAGRSYDYVERVRAVDGAVAFFNDNKEDLTRKVSGAAQYVAKQKGCDVDVTGATSHALEEGVERQLEKYVRDRNEAHRRIDRYRASLGKENAAALEKQADAVSFASYVVHIDMVEHKLRLRRMLEEIEAVKASIDESVEAERAFQSSGKRTDEERKASEARIEELGRSKAMLDSSATQAKQIDESMDERIAAAQKTYREAMDRLLATIRKNAGLPAEPSDG
ncbi:hypothetical protein WME99_15455 [Sorangium sp. So ce136]|uniref:hypothetical protein n=1 Tax=Sorangium sp. So ce136 TaxID=3133284 RepID=UPI003EFFD9D1